MTTARLLTPEKKIAHIYDNRYRLRYPNPLSLEVIPIGKTLTEMEWTRFTQHLSNKEKQDCGRKKNGTVIFIGEGGLEALKHFQTKFNSRFHLRMICANASWAKDGLQLAINKRINIQELHYKTPHRAMTMLNDPDAILKLTSNPH